MLNRHKSMGGGRRAATGAGVDIKNRARLISDRPLPRVPFLRVIVSPCHLVKIRWNRNATSRPLTLRSESRSFPAQGDSIHCSSLEATCRKTGRHRDSCSSMCCKFRSGAFALKERSRVERVRGAPSDRLKSKCLDFRKPALAQPSARVP